MLDMINAQRAYFFFQKLRMCFYAFVNPLMGSAESSLVKWNITLKKVRMIT